METAFGRINARLSKYPEFLNRLNHLLDIIKTSMIEQPWQTMQRTYHYRNAGTRQRGCGRIDKEGATKTRRDYLKRWGYREQVSKKTRLTYH